MEPYDALQQEIIDHDLATVNRLLDDSAADLAAEDNELFMVSVR